MQNTVSVGCFVGLYCTTIRVFEEYKIVKNRDLVSYKPKMGTTLRYGTKLYYGKEVQFADYADNELVEDCPLAKALIGKRLGDSCKINEYNYVIEKIIFPDGRIVSVKTNSVSATSILDKKVNTPEVDLISRKTTVLPPEFKEDSIQKPIQTTVPTRPQNGTRSKIYDLNDFTNGRAEKKIDWKRGFAKECTEQELQVIRYFATFMEKEFPHFVGESKTNRIAFYDPKKQLNGVQYSQFWFIKRGGILTFRFKLDQNEVDESKYSRNVLIADNLQLNSIKVLVRFILS